MELKPICVSPATTDVRDILAGTLDSRVYYGSLDVEVACNGVGAAACKEGCVSGCKDSSKSGGDCSKSCKEGCMEGCKSSCHGGNK